MGPIAQSVEQRTFNPWVDGSSPSGPTSSNSGVVETKFQSFLSVVTSGICALGFIQ